MKKLINKQRYEMATSYAIRRQFESKTAAGRVFWKSISTGIRAKYYFLLAGETV